MRASTLLSKVPLTTLTYPLSQHLPFCEEGGKPGLLLGARAAVWVLGPPAMETHQDPGTWEDSGIQRNP